MSKQRAGGLRLERLLVMKIITNILYYLLVAIVLIIGVLLAASYFQLTGSYEFKVVKSGSMEPAIKVGSLVLIKPATSYREGEVVTYGRDTKSEIPTTHRIIASRAEGGQVFYTVKGDANGEPDPREIQVKEIVGKVLLTVPWLGYLLDFARQPLGFVLLIAVPALGVIVDEARKIWREIKKIKTAKANQEQHAPTI